MAATLRPRVVASAVPRASRHGIPGQATWVGPHGTALWLSSLRLEKHLDARAAARERVRAARLATLRRALGVPAEAVAALADAEEEDPFPRPHLRSVSGRFR